MRKFFYITQLFAVVLLMVQLSGCGSMPDPEPISKKYAKPTEVIGAGVPVMSAEGMSIYTPEDGMFRFAGTVFANADGTMSAWYSTPGGSTGTLPARVSLNGPGAGGGPYPMHGAKQNGAIKFTFKKDFYGWAVRCPGWSKNTACFAFKLYSWSSDYQTTLGTTPLAAVDFMEYIDNSWLEINASNGGYTDATGNDKFPAGTYLIYMERIAADAGCWGGGLGDGMTTWYNGSVLSGTASYDNAVQYVSPADISFASQARYYKAPKVGITTEWTGNKDKIMVAPTSGKADKFYAKELSVVKAGDYYYMAYTGSQTVKEITDNNVFVARSKGADSTKWEKWNGTGWGGDPAPVITTALSEEGKYYGVGQPSMVIKDGTLYIYYTYCDDASGIYNTHMATATATDENWPAALTDKGMVIDRSTMSNTDGVSVVYAEELGKFLAICGVNIDAASSYMAVWESADGMTGWTQTGTLVTNIRVYAKYPRFVTNSEGHVTSAAHFIIYQYGTARGTYKSWMVPFKFAE